MNAEVQKLVEFARVLADPNFSLSVPETAKRVIAALADEVEKCQAHQ